jgi:hypothetical protein
MKSSSARILETRHWSDERLCRLIERFHDVGPTEDDLGRVHDALEQTLGSDLYEMFAEPHSGVRAMPQPPLARPEELPFEEPPFEESLVEDPPFEELAHAEPPFEEKPQAVPAEPIESRGIWWNPSFSRTLAACSLAAVLVLMWTRVERTEVLVASKPPAFKVRSGENSNSSAPAPNPRTIERRAVPQPATYPLRAADIERPRKPTARARVASAASDIARTFPPETGGRLNINSIPYSKVVLDGRPLGDTPRVEIAVAAGMHTVLFVHPEHGRIQREVYVDSGRTVLAAVRFD